MSDAHWEQQGGDSEAKNWQAESSAPGFVPVLLPAKFCKGKTEMEEEEAQAELSGLILILNRFGESYGGQLSYFYFGGTSRFYF